MKAKAKMPDESKFTLNSKFLSILLWLYPVFLILYFGIISNHVVIYQSQLSLFFIDPYYISQYFDHPGGLIDFISSFLLQFYLFFWIGVIISSLLNLLLFVIIRKINKILFPGLQTDFISFIPAILLFGLQNSHAFLPADSIGFIIVSGLFYFILLLKRKFSQSSILIISKNSQLLFVLFTLLSVVILYFAVAGYVWIFVFMLSLNEIQSKSSFKSVLLPFLAVGIAILFCWLGYRYFFIISSKDIWFGMLPIKIDYTWDYLPWLLIVFLGFLPLIPLFRNSKSSQWSKKQFVAPILTLSLIVIISLLAFNGKAKKQFLSRYYILNSQYSNALQLVEESPTTNMLVSFGTNLSLFKEGKLLDYLFQNFQGFRINGLMLYGDKKPLSDMLKSKLYYELGYMNEAHRWAFESLVQSGETPDAMLMLVKTNVINGNYKIAEKYLNLLNKALFYKDTTIILRKFLNNETLIQQNNEFASKRKQLPEYDQFVDNSEERNLEFLLKNHPDNKMAFEYLLACRLLNIQVPEIANNIADLKKMGYPILPKSIQEAYILYWASIGKKPDLAGYQLNENYISTFVEYSKMLANFRESTDKDQKYPNIKSKFGNTYWFYVDFVANN